MSYSSNMAGLDLFTAPFHSTQTPRAAMAVQPKQTSTTAPLPKSAVSPAQQTKAPETHSQPAKANPQVKQEQQPNILQKPVPTEKTPAVQTEQDKSPEPEQKPQAEAQVPAQAQPEPPKKELTLDMSDRTIPAGNPLDASEDAKRKAHEEAEAKRKAEWDAKQLAKKQAEEAAIQKLQAMSDADVMAASTDRIRTDVERITRRNMKECVADHIQSVCRKDPAFARRTMHPHKSIIHCFQYINRKAKDFIQQEMKDNDIKPENGVYGGDVPDGLCYQWAEDYFNDMDAQEDKEKEERFTPRPYVSTASKAKETTNPKKATKKTTAKKEPKKKQEPKNDYQQMSLPGV